MKVEHLKSLLNRSTELKLLIKFEAEGDEFPICGMAIMAEAVWNQRVKTFIELEGAEDSITEWYFGSNQYIEVDDRERFVRNHYKTRLISDGEAETLIGLLGMQKCAGEYEYGTFFNLLEYI